MLMFKLLNDYSQIKHMNVIDEWSNYGLCEQFKEPHQVIVLAKYAGSGKSSACKHMKSSGCNQICMFPTNKFVKEHRIEANTCSYLLKMKTHIPVWNN